MQPTNYYAKIWFSFTEVFVVTRDTSTLVFWPEKNDLLFWEYGFFREVISRGGYIKVPYLLLKRM